ncbi:MAG: DNA polymerase III subunit gamma/tau [Ilumatobacteraceae bacterium]
MAIQSLYRRYRPRRFAELKGQEHVVRALRNAVINHREGQAYLFSGPRGTGKTSTARILAKVLNCEAPKDGEPCCVCASCVAIDNGLSYDVLELDAASNNGVESMRDLIERSALGNPGRHRVFILDEVHMLSKPAEAALLKTLEEPPPHVVFVLATTDPQKVSETIRSRTQHLQFHLLSMTDLEPHVRWVIADAGLKVSEEAIKYVLQQGGGSARDALSALELVAAGGGEVDEQISLDEFIEALIDHDPGRALTAVAFAVQRGADPRGLTDDIVRQLREAFLSQMAPELVQLPEQNSIVVSEQARRLGTGSVVHAIEVLGDVLIEMRHAADARLLLEVALVKLTSQVTNNDAGALLARIERLEVGIAAARDVTGPIVRPAPVDIATGRAQLGGKAKSSSGAPTGSGGVPRPQLRSSVAKPSSTPSDDVVGSQPTDSPLGDRDVMGKWSEVLTGLKPLVRALYSAVQPRDCVNGVLTVVAPNQMHSSKAQEHSEIVQDVLSRVAGRRITLAFDAPASLRGKTNSPSSNFDPTVESAAPRNSTANDDYNWITQAFPGSQVIDNSK